MSGPTNAVMGDLDEPVNLPETTVPDEVLLEEQKLAKYSKTAEFKRLREFMEARIKFYQNYLPDGRPIKDVNLPNDVMATNWKAASIVVSEFTNILSEYDQAAEVVKDAKRQS